MSISTDTNKRRKLRNNEYYGFQEIQDKLFKQSQKNFNFTRLYENIISKENILLAFRNIKKNTGSKTKGTDGKTISSIERLSHRELIELIRRKLSNFQPQAVRRVEIPKGDGRTRPLGIPTITDRLIQQCFVQILDPIVEAKFYKHSYGFRQFRGAKHALARAYHLAQANQLHYVVDVDIKGFFDNINHGKLIKQMWSMGIRDKKVLTIISKMLKAEIAGEGIPHKGVPQGGILSPILSNIVLNELDWWIASQWELFPTEKQYYSRGSVQSNKHNSMRNHSNLKEIFIVRYADDFKIFCRDAEQAKKTFIATKKWLKERLELEVSPEKSGIVNIKKQYSEFLGFKIKVRDTKKKSGRKYVVKSHMGNKAYQRIVKTLREKAKELQHNDGQMSGRTIVERYNAYVVGVHSYYNCATHCSKDFTKIANNTRTTMKNRNRPRRKRKGDVMPEFLRKLYGDSLQIRFLNNTCLAPIGYVQHKKAFQYKGYSPYIAEERIMYHNDLRGVNSEDLKYLMENPIKGETVEYNDNRISKFVSQHGKCFVMKSRMSVNKLECHHKNPKQYGGTDHYRNLVFINKDIHKLVHAVKEDTIIKYRNMFSLNAEQIASINKLRKSAHNKPIL